MSENRPGLFGRMFGRSASPSAVEQRGLWTRTDGDLSINDPNQLVWLGSDTLAGILGRNAPAESLAVTTRATSLITGPLTAAPFRLVDDDTGEDLPTPRWLGDPMLLRPDARMVDGLAAFPHARRLTRSGFWREVVRSCVWQGMGALVYSVDSTGQPLAGTMRQIHPGALHMNAQSRWVLGAGGEELVFDREGYLQLGPSTYRIAVMRNPLSPVGEDGMSLGVFGLSPSSFATAATVDTYTRGTLSSGVPAGYLKVSNPAMTPEAAQALRADWLTQHGGDTRSIAVLGAMVEFTPISFSPVDAEAVALKRMSIGDIAFAFGLPPEVLGVSLANSSTYVNVGDTWARLKTFGLSTWISELEDLLSSLAPYGRSVRVDLSEFEGDMTTAAERQPAAPAPPQLAAVPQQEDEAV